MRTHQVLPCTLAIGVGTVEILLRPLAIAMCAHQFFLRPLMIGLRPLQILLRSFAVGLRPLQLFLRPLTLAVRSLQIVVRSLPFGLRPLTIRLCAFEVCLCSLQIGLRTLQIGVCALPFRVGSFEIRLHATAFGRDRFFQFTTRLAGGVRGRLFRLGSRARHCLGEGTLDIRTRGGDFGLEPRAPLRVNPIEFGRPPLFRFSVGTLPRFLEGLLVALRKTPEMGVELSLKLGANGVNHAANWFLGH